MHLSLNRFLNVISRVRYIARFRGAALHDTETVQAVNVVRAMPKTSGGAKTISAVYSYILVSPRSERSLHCHVVIYPNIFY